jgi:hypothetical protein
MSGPGRRARGRGRLAAELDEGVVVGVTAVAMSNAQGGGIAIAIINVAYARRP